MTGKPTTDIDLDISGLGLRLRALDDDLFRRLRETWRAYVSRGGDQPRLLDVVIAAGSPVAATARFSAAEMTASFRDGAAHFAMDEGELDLDAGGRGQARLAPGPGAVRFFALVNLLSAGLAWRAPRHGALLLHAAGIVIDGRGFVLIGGAGTGKTTWSELARSAGAVFVSDDLVLVDASGLAATLLATPIRGDHPTPHGPSRWPLAALLLPAHGTPPGLTPAPRIAIEARLAANLPFVVEELARDPTVLDLARRLVRLVPCYTLTFAREPSFVGLLRGLATP